LVNDQRDAQILFYVFISIYKYLHVLSTQCSSSGETNYINTASGNSHSILVAEMCAGWKKSSSNDDFVQLSTMDYPFSCWLRQLIAYLLF